MNFQIANNFIAEFKKAFSPYLYILAIIPITLFLTFSCSDDGGTTTEPGNTEPDNTKLYELEKNFKAIITAGKIPNSLDGYDSLSKSIFSSYTPGARVTARYVKTNGAGDKDGTSWNNAAADLRPVISGITNVSDNHIYVVLIASGTYKSTASYSMKNPVAIVGACLNNSICSSYSMKNQVAIVGGFTADTYNRAGETRLDGDGAMRVFYHNKNNLDKSAILYGLTITNGNAGDKYEDSGGGMFNYESSPTLINVTFSGNRVRWGNGGGMYNKTSSPTLNGVTFSNNTATWGGGMYNENSSFPFLNGVTFSGNLAAIAGGGMYNRNNSFPTLNGVTFSDNTADYGGGMYNGNTSFPILTEVTFSSNTANKWGGGMYNRNNSSPTLNGVTFSDNTATWGGGMYNNNSSPTLNGVTFSGNSANSGGGMYNDNSSPTLSGVTFSANTANSGGGMYNDNSSPTLSGVTFSANTASYGGGIYNILFSSPILSGVTFSANTASYGGGGIYNNGSSPTLSGVTFSANTASYGGGIYNILFSSPILSGGTFSGNSATWGVGLYNFKSSPILIGVTFFTNNSPGGGTVYHDGEGMTLTLINTLLWGNSNTSIFLNNDTDNTENLNLYYSLIEGGTNTSRNAKGMIRLWHSSIPYPINLRSISVITSDPMLGSLIDNGGAVKTVSITENSPAKDAGAYVKGVKVGNSYAANNVYYSIDNANWYRASNGRPANPPADAVDLTAKDARGYGRVGRPDIGAYEVGGTDPNAP